MKQTITLLILSCCLFMQQRASAQCDPATNLNATYNNNVSTFTWDAVANADNYTLQIKYLPYSWSNILYEETVPTNSLVHVGIIQSATLNWRIIANCSNGTSTSATAVYALPCPQPTALNVTNIDVTSATINWTPAPGLNTYLSDFIASYRVLGTTAWTSLGHTADSYKNITGLLPGTTYEYCVQQTCAYFNSPAGMGQFTTLPSCFAPTNLINTNTSATQATLNWTAAANALTYNVEYKASSSSTWISAGSTSLTSKTISGLSQATIYDWRVMTICSGPSNPFVAAQFTTSGTNGCGVPTGLNVTTIGNTSATFNCASLSGVSYYQYQIRVAGTSSWYSYVSMNNTTVINGMMMNTAYEFRMRSKCGGVYSPFSPIVTFSTANCLSSGINSAEWIDYFNVGSMFRTSGKETGGYKSTGQTIHIQQGGTRSGIISAGFLSGILQENYAVYIDFNRNGNYADPGELVASGMFNNSTNNNFTVTVPSTVAIGYAGMRAILKRSGTGVIDPCYTGFTGETEDFIVNILAPSVRLASNESIEEEMIVSPNPSQGIFHVAMGSEQHAIYCEISNMNGSVIQRKSYNEERAFDIDLSLLPAGLYILRVKDDSGKMHTQKLVRQN